jgi:small subunit ribosomal protein S6
MGGTDAQSRREWSVVGQGRHPDIGLTVASVVVADSRRPGRRGYTSSVARLGRVRCNALLSRKDRGRLSPEEVEIALRRYEVMVILDPDLEERTVEPSLDQYLNLVRQDGGNVETVDIWGRRRMAYDIKKKSEGIYAVIELDAEPATVKELDRQLTLNESVLRTKVIRPELH